MAIYRRPFANGAFTLLLQKVPWFSEVTLRSDASWMRLRVAHSSFLGDSCSHLILAMNKTRRTDQLIVLAALVLLVIGAFLVIRPFVYALLWAVVLSFSCWPAYRQLLTWVGPRSPS